LIDLSFLVNALERKTTFLYFNQVVKTIKSKTKSSWNNLKHIGTVRIDGFKLEGGELFKEDFRKLLKQE